MRTEFFESICVNKEKKTSKDGVEYGVITFMDGSKPVNVVVKDNTIYELVENMKPCQVQLGITLYNNFNKIELLEVRY